jgi:pimeloyl-ACP methyl ester carboxylesterase
VLRRVVRSIAAGAGAVGALAFVNRRLSGALSINHLAGTPRRHLWRGYEIFAAEAGEGTPVVLVHGVHAGASTYEFRNLFALLARRHRVVAFDFLGCGLSEKPRLDYTPSLFVEQIVDAIRELAGGGPAAVVASGLGAAFATRAAAGAPAFFSHLVTICPTGMAALAQARPATPLFRAPIVGESLYNALASKSAIRWFLEHEVYGDRAHVTNEIVDAYYAVMHQNGARWIVSSLAAGLLDCDLARDLPFVEAPALILWGKRAKSNPARNAAEYAELAKKAEVELFVRSALLPHDEESEAVARRIEAFLG